LALDASARVRDEVDPQELSGEVGEAALEELIQQLSEEERNVVQDAVRSMIKDRRRGVDGGYGSDIPPPFEGRPTPGGEPLGSTNWSERSAAHDRRSRALAADMATRQRAENSRSFLSMFPDARRIGTSGF
jgi:hypothetical protein